MRRSLDAILALVLIAWLPFCCCQVRSAAGALTRAEATSERACAEQASCDRACAERSCVARDCATCSCESSQVPSCCAEVEPSQAPASCCHPEPGKPAKGNCCSTCKDRVLPAATALPDPDRFGVESPAALVMALPAGAGDLLATLAWTVSNEGSPGGAPPPSAPAGRQALVAHGVLVV